MLSFSVRMRFAPEDHDDVAHFLTQLAHASRLEPAAFLTFRILSNPTRRRY